MSYPQLSQLTHFTKLLILVLVILATEYHSNLFIYVATAVWLELAFIVRIERNVIMWYKAKRNKV
jgi:hypothetical protein